MASGGIVMDAQERAEIDRANRGKAFWEPFCLANWQLMGWTDDVTATFIDGAGRCLEMRPGHVELIRQAEQTAREPTVTNAVLLLMRLTPAQREDVFSDFCVRCGSDDPECRCSNPVVEAVREKALEELEQQIEKRDFNSSWLNAELQEIIRALKDKP